MIETILLTVLFTIFGVGVVISLVWLMVTSWNVKKMSKANTNLSSEISEVYKNYDEKNKEIYTEMDRKFVEVFRTMDTRFVEVFRTYDAQIKEIYSKMDRRFDKQGELLAKMIQFQKSTIDGFVSLTPTENSESSEKAWNLTQEQK